MFTQLTFFVLLITFTLVYLITSTRSYSSFYDQLWERAILIAQVNFSRSAVSEVVYRHLLDNYQSSMHEEKSYIFEMTLPRLADSLRTILPHERDVRQLMAGKQRIEFERDGHQAVAIYYPGTRNHIVIVSAYDEQGTENMRNLRELLIIILILSTLIVFFTGRVYAKRVMEPVRRIIDNVKSITASNLKRSLREERGNDELSELSRTFNQMIERLRTAFDMQNSFIRNASHELRNPLAAILGETELALNKPRSQQEYVETLNTILEESERLNFMMRDLLMLAQTDFDFSRVRRETIALIPLLREIAEELQRVYPEAQIEIVPEETPRVFETTGALSILRLALLNLMGNAVKFSDGKPVQVRLHFTRNGRIEIEIVDHGIGIPHGELRHIAQPFYRGINTSGYKGTGIGLALAKRIVELHNGRLDIESKIDEGTKVTIRLNRAE
jgi:signal transduction histidine kinase